MNENPFELVISGLKFEYQINYDKKSNPSSITFTYKYKLPMNVPYRTSIDETCNDFIDILTGKKLKEMTSPEEKNYLIWLYKSYSNRKHFLIECLENVLDLN